MILEIVSGKRKERQMAQKELAEYAKTVIGDSVERVGYLAGISRATIYRVMAGKGAKPETYAKLALAIGTNRVEQREIYKEFMDRSGYLDLLPDDATIDRDLDRLVLDEIRERYPEIYAAAVATIEARRRGDFPTRIGEKREAG